MRHPNPKLNKQRGLILSLITLLLVAAWGAVLPLTAAAESGTCGEGLSWSLSGGTLTITGSGDMTRFNELNMPPWYDLRDRICRVVLPEGLRSIAPLAFYECQNLTAVYIPDSVLSIGSYAFAHCERLESVRFGDTLATIDSAAFHSCYKLTAMTLPNGLQSLGNQAFYRCESLPAVTIPPYLSRIGTSAFAYCKSLLRAEIKANLATLPEWTFYGCERLHEVILPETVGAVEDYAFKKCENLDTVYFDGDEDKRDVIQSDMERELPGFEQTGSISSSVPMESVTVGQYTEHEDGTVTQQNTTVSGGDGMTVVTVVEHTHAPDTTQGGSYTADITVTVGKTEAWDDVTNTVKKNLSSINESVTRAGATVDPVDVKVYLQVEGGVDNKLVEEMAGRDVHLSIVSPNGSESRMECEELVRENLSGNYDYSVSVGDADPSHSDKLGAEDCFELTFDQSANINSEVVVQLPQTKPNSNAYLYQVEEDGELTRVQASVVDDDSNAHFYLGAVDKDTEYLVGVNVPGEDPSDAIVPDEMLSHYGGAIENIQKIDYVITGRQSSWGLSVLQVTWLLLGILTACAILVGIIMAVWNHRRLKRGYVPDLSEYEDDDAPAEA